MPCSGCGKQRYQSQTQRVHSRETRKPIYVVTAPDGSSKEFERYIEAAGYRREVNGTLTTSTAAS